MTEPDIAHSAKEMFGAQVVYVFACLHLARWISLRNNGELNEKKKKRLFDRLDPCASSVAFLNLLPENSTVRENLGSRYQDW